MAWLLLRSLLSCGFTTVYLHKFSIKLNLISAIAACLSLPLSSSIWIIICSSIFFSLSSIFNLSKIIPSDSTSFVAANLVGILALLAWSSIKWRIPCIHLWTAPSSLPEESQKSILPGLSLYLATWIAWSISSSIPSFFAAEIGITGIPKSSSNLLIIMVPPFSLTSSIILSASTIGISNSISCIVKYKFLSMLVASTIFIIPRGLWFKRNSLVTTSSLE